MKQLSEMNLIELKSLAYDLIIAQMDKLLHFIAGMVIFLIASQFMDFAIIPVIVIAVLKEVYDLKVKHSYMDIWDITATIAGGLVMYMIVIRRR